MRVQGTCYAVFAYDLGFALDLDAAEGRITDERRRERFRNRRRAPQAEGQRPSPLRVSQAGETLDLGSARTEPTTEVVLFEVAAACIRYALPFDCPLEDLVNLSATLYDNEALLDDSRRRCEQLLGALGDAVSQPLVSDIVEDYVIFDIRPTQGIPVETLWTEHAPTVARILRAEPDPLSEQEVADALSQRASYGRDDTVIVNWFAAILVGDGMDDERTVLEFGVVELLELRILDDKLDRDLDDAYHVMIASRNWRASLRPRTTTIDRLSQLQADGARLFEGVNNAFKLVGDQYLARLYGVVAQRFRLSRWDTIIERKLATLDSTYEKLATRASNRRLELLEWIIVLLIAIDVVIYFF